MYDKYPPLLSCTPFISWFLCGYKFWGFMWENIWTSYLFIIIKHDNLKKHKTFPPSFFFSSLSILSSPISPTTTHTHFPLPLSPSPTSLCSHGSEISHPLYWAFYVLFRSRNTPSGLEMFLGLPLKCLPLCFLHSHFLKHLEILNWFFKFSSLSGLSCGLFAMQVLGDFSQLFLPHLLLFWTCFCVSNFQTILLCSFKCFVFIVSWFSYYKWKTMFFQGINKSTFVLYFFF